MQKITVEQIDKEDDFLKLREEWNNLLQQSRSNTIFLTWEWLYTWWEIFKKGRKLFILLAKENEEIIGIAPLLKRRVYYFGILPFDRLEFLATGEEEKDETCSVYLNFIIKKGKEQEVVDHILRYLLEQSSHWDEIILRDMIETNGNTILFKKFSNNGSCYKTVSNSKCIYINLPNSWEEYLVGLGAKKRRNIRRDRKLLGKAFIINYTVVDFNESKDFPHVLKPMKEIHQKEWQSKNKPGVFASSKFTQFVNKLSLRTAELKWLKLSYLKLDGKEMAFRYTFSYNNKIYDYITGFIPTSDERIGLGTVLLSYCIEDVIKSGTKEWDFLKGGSGSWKGEWANAERELMSIKISKKTVKYRYFLICAFIVNNLKKLKRKIIKK